MRKAIVVVDMQNDFVDGALGTQEAQAMLPRLVEKLKAEQTAGTVLVFTMDTHGADYLETQEGKKLPVEHCIRGTTGWQIADALQLFVREAAAVIEKPTFGATALPAVLANYDEIEFVGLCTDICVTPTPSSQRHSTQRSASVSMLPAARALPPKATRTPSPRCGCVRSRCTEWYAQHCLGSVSLYLR